MKFLIVLTSLLIGLNGYSQKCKYEKNEVDNFSGSMVKITKSQKVFGDFNSECFFTAKREGEAVFVKLTYRRSHQTKMQVPTNTELGFVFSDNSTVKAVKLSSDYYSLSKEDALSINTKQIVSIRYNYLNEAGENTFIDLNIKKKDAATVSALVGCII
jgi:hypothetical protein